MKNPKRGHYRLSKWSHEEIEKFVLMVKQHGKNWKKVSEGIVTKTPEEC